MENTSQDQLNHIKGVIESLLFVNEKPVMLEQMKNVLGTVTTAQIKKAINEIIDGFEKNNRGITIQEIAGGFQMLSNPLYAEYIRRFYKTKHKEKLSKPALETLAIVAYKQPVTRGDVEVVRGVNSDGVVGHLLQKELVKVIGRKDVPGRPFLYGTTKQFLEYFGLKSLDDMPKLEEFALLAERSGEGQQENKDDEYAKMDEQETDPQDEAMGHPGSQITEGASDESLAEETTENENGDYVLLADIEKKEMEPSAVDDPAAISSPSSAEEEQDNNERGNNYDS